MGLGLWTRKHFLVNLWKGGIIGKTGTAYGNKGKCEQPRLRCAISSHIWAWGKGKISNTDPIFKILIVCSSWRSALIWIFKNIALSIYLDYWAFGVPLKFCTPSSLTPPPHPNPTFGWMKLAHSFGLKAEDSFLGAWWKCRSALSALNFTAQGSKSKTLIGPIWVTECIESLLSQIKVISLFYLNHFSSYKIN